MRQRALLRNTTDSFTRKRYFCVCRALSNCMEERGKEAKYKHAFYEQKNAWNGDHHHGEVVVVVSLQQSQDSGHHHQHQQLVSK